VRRLLAFASSRLVPGASTAVALGGWRWRGFAGDPPVEVDPGRRAGCANARMKSR
jgi:hypothetical protein